MKRNPEHQELRSSDPRLQDWEPIFRAAEAKRFPSRMLGVLEMSECMRAMRRSRVVPQSRPRPR